MRTSSPLVPASASALLALGVAAGPALADPGTSAPAAEPGGSTGGHSGPAAA